MYRPLHHPSNQSRPAD